MLVITVCRTLDEVFEVVLLNAFTFYDLLFQGQKIPREGLNPQEKEKRQKNQPRRMKREQQRRSIQQQRVKRKRHPRVKLRLMQGRQVVKPPQRVGKQRPRVGKQFPRVGKQHPRVERRWRPQKLVRPPLKRLSLLLKKITKKTLRNNED